MLRNTCQIINGYAGYNRVLDLRDNAPIQLAYYWAHARRKLHGLSRRASINCFAINCQATDSGPEYISGTLMTWAEKHGVRLEHIQPGKPQQNAYIERYNRTVRGEWLSQYIFETIEEAQNQATEWLWTYNNERPNTGIGGITPAMKLKTAT